MKCNHNLSEEYLKFECLKGDYVIIDTIKGIILKKCKCSQENWTNFQELSQFGFKNNIKAGLFKNMKKYLKGDNKN